MTKCLFTLKPSTVSPLPNTFKTMITVIKETTYTVNGHDCILQLIHNDCKKYDFVCENCFFFNWVDYKLIAVDCCTVHGCTVDPDTYFQISEL